MRKIGVPNKRGNGTHLQYTYKGFYYRQELTPSYADCASPGVLCGCCFGLELYIFSQRRGPRDHFLQLQIRRWLCFRLLACWGMSGLGGSCFFYVSAPRDMTIYKYRSTALQLSKGTEAVSWFIYSECLLVAAVTYYWLHNGFSS